MTIPLGVRSQGGPWDMVIRKGSSVMGFILREPPQKRQITNAAPRIRVGGDAGYAAGAFDKHVMHGFETGGDRDLFQSGDKRYDYSDGNVALYIEKRATLASQWGSTDASVTATVRNILDFSSSNGAYVVVGTGTKLRAYNTSSGLWGNQGTFASNCIGLYATDGDATTPGYLFIACGSGDDFWRWDGTSGSGMSQPASGAKATCFSYWGSTLWRGVGSTIVPATNNNGSTWGTAVNVGWTSTWVYDLIDAGDVLLIAKPEGLYGYDGTNVRLIVDARHVRSTANFRGGYRWRGDVFMPYAGALYKATITANNLAGNFSDVTPRSFGDELREAFGHGRPLVAFGGPSHVYMAFDDGESVYPELLLYNGVGFHQVYRGASGDTMNAAGYSALMGWLLVNDGSTRYKRLRNTAEAEYPDYASSGYWTTPYYDAGSPDELKAWADITLDVESASATETVTVSYRADSESSWTAVGTPLTAAGKHTLPLGGLDAQVSAKKIQFKLALARGSDASLTPRLKWPMVVSALPTPATNDAQSMQIHMDRVTELRNRTLGYGIIGDYYTTEQIDEFLDECADSETTLLVIDSFGRRRRMKMTDKSHTWQFMPEPDPREVGVVVITMMEMFAGRTHQVEIPLTIGISASQSVGARGMGFAAMGFADMGQVNA